MNRDAIFGMIRAERARQDKKFPADWRPGSMVEDRKYLVLAEEVGEVAKAILENDANLIQELVQVAAVAVAWLESYS